MYACISSASLNDRLRLVVGPVMYCIWRIRIQPTLLVHTQLFSAFVLQLQHSPYHILMLVHNENTKKSLFVYGEAIVTLTKFRFVVDAQQ